MDDFMNPVKDHIYNHVIKHHPNWKDEINSKKTARDRIEAAKKLVRMATAETKDPYGRFVIGPVASRLYFKAKEN